MSKLSIFIDESGDFDLKSTHSPFYLYTLVFHDQSNLINKQVESLGDQLKWSELGIDYLHAGPIIRRESHYSTLDIDERRSLFIKMYHFTRRCPINYAVFSYVKREYPDKFALEARMARDLTEFLQHKKQMFDSFKQVVIYYDNGQIEMTKLLNTVFAINKHSFELRNVSPKNYRLFQAADLICTLELISIKQKIHLLSSSERQFFYKPKEPQRPYIATIRKKLL